LGRFTQPDTVLPEPGDPQQLNRFAYARNNPLRYTDQTGHYIEEWTGSTVDEAHKIGNPRPVFYTPQEAERVWGVREAMEVSREVDDTAPSSVAPFRLLPEGCAVGLRLEATLSRLDLNVDLMFFGDSGEIDLFFTLGYQESSSPGGDVSAGILWAQGVPNKEAYKGKTMSVGGNSPSLGPVSIEGNISIGMESPPNANAGVTSYVGIGLLPNPYPYGSGFSGFGFTVDVGDLIHSVIK
jgi:hypothetical protein